MLALFAALSLSACGGANDDEDASTSAPSPSPTSTTDAQDAGAPIRIRFRDTQLSGRMFDNATARDLAAQLPLTLSFRDHNNVEKTAPLPRALSLDGAPARHDPAAGDIGYWAPDSDFVLYYDDDAPSFDGIVRIGRLDGDLDAIARLPEGARVTIEPAR
jgi:hypothetical protein